MAPYRQRGQLDRLKVRRGFGGTRGRVGRQSGAGFRASDMRACLPKHNSPSDSHADGPLCPLALARRFCTCNGPPVSFPVPTLAPVHRARRGSSCSGQQQRQQGPCQHERSSSLGRTLSAEPAAGLFEVTQCQLQHLSCLQAAAAAAGKCGQWRFGSA